MPHCCTWPRTLLQQLCAFVSAGKAERNLSNIGVARAGWLIAFGLPGTHVTSSVATRPALSWCVGTLFRPLGPLHRCRILKVMFCHGCNRATPPDAIPLNYGHRLLAGAVIMHGYACHWCDPSSARLLRVIAFKSCSLSVLMLLLLLFRLGSMTVGRCKRHRSRDGGNTSALPSKDWVGRGLAGL